MLSGHGRFADASKVALKVLEQTPENGDAIIALTEAARSKEDIQAAEQQLQKYPQEGRRFFPPRLGESFFSAVAT